VDISTGVRIAFIVPTGLFLVIVMWDWFFHAELVDDLDGLDKKHVAKHSDLVFSHYMKASFAEALVLFCANSLLVFLELQDQVDGAIFLIAGLVLSITGLILGSRLSKHAKICGWLFILVLAFSVCQLTFLVSYAQEFVFMWPIGNIVNPWLLSILSFVVVTILLAKLFRD
jgi:hypothetical protein